MNQTPESPVPARRAASASRGHLVGLDGLRAIAALSVVATHTAEHTTGFRVLGRVGEMLSFGAQGLTLFFALSGFLLFRPFVRAILDDAPMPSIRRYLTNRALRIYPAYLVIYLIVNFVLLTAYVHGTAGIVDGDVIGRITAPETLVPDLFLVQSLVPGAIATGIGPAWSLGAELSFYLLLPLLALGAAALARRLPRVIAVCAPPVLLIVIGLSTTGLIAVLTQGLDAHDALVFSWGQTWTAVLDRSLVSQGDLFGYGMLGAVAVEVLQRRDVPDPAWARIGVLAAAAVWAAAALHVGGPFATNAVGVAAGTLILLTVLPRSDGRPNVGARLLELAPIRGIGLISYSLYLWHEPIIWWLRARGLLDGQGVGGVALDLVIVLAVSITLATLTYLLVEKPAMRLRGALRFRRVAV